MSACKRAATRQRCIRCHRPLVKRSPLAHVCTHCLRNDERGAMLRSVAHEVLAK